jgi:hypothetical protein
MGDPSGNELQAATGAERRQALALNPRLDRRGEIGLRLLGLRHSIAAEIGLLSLGLRHSIGSGGSPTVARRRVRIGFPRLRKAAAPT